MPQSRASIDPLQPAASRPPASSDPSLGDRLLQKFLGGKRRDTPAEATSQTNTHPRPPAQLALPLEEGGRRPRAGSRDEPSTPDDTPSLFSNTRRIEAVLSYEQADLQQIIPDANATLCSPQIRLILPGGTGLILYEDEAGAMAFDWMQWGRKSARDAVTMDAMPGATINLAELGKDNRAIRRLTRRRCVVPLTRYSVPDQQDEMWSHRWIVPAHGRVACAAGIWMTDPIGGNRFAMISPTGHGPLLLAESEMLLWLRAPLKEALSRLAGVEAKA